MVCLWRLSAVTLSFCECYLLAYWSARDCCLPGKLSFVSVIFWACFPLGGFVSYTASSLLALIVCRKSCLLGRLFACGCWFLVSTVFMSVIYLWVRSAGQVISLCSLSAGQVVCLWVFLPVSGFRLSMLFACEWCQLANVACVKWRRCLFGRAVCRASCLLRSFIYQANCPLVSVVLPGKLSATGFCLLESHVVYQRSFRPHREAILLWCSPQSWWQDSAKYLEITEFSLHNLAN
jgi:hypothetical protein